MSIAEIFLAALGFFLILFILAACTQGYEEVCRPIVVHGYNGERVVIDEYCVWKER